MFDSQNPRLNALRRVTATLIDSRIPAFSLRPEVLELAEILRDANADCFTQDEEISSGETRTSSGLALSPTMAAMCAVDYVRTIIFIRGIRDAIEDVRKKRPDRPVRILYAGCGPFGTLAVPLMAVFDSSEAVFTLLDIHPESIQAVKAVVSHLDLEQSVSGIQATDALRYRVQGEQPPDVIVIEVMQACLDSEPQVAITCHLLEQAPHATLVPEEVSIDLKLVNPSGEFNLANQEGEPHAVERDRISLGPMFVVNRHRVKCWSSSSSRSDTLPGASVDMPDSWDERYQPMLFTKIRVYRDQVLQDYDSGLTCPKTIAEKGLVRPGGSLHFSYLLGSNPHLRMQSVNEFESRHGRESEKRMESTGGPAPGWDD
jgi:hypothetical protein